MICNNLIIQYMPLVDVNFLKGVGIVEPVGYDMRTSCFVAKFNGKRCRVSSSDFLSTLWHSQTTFMDYKGLPGASPYDYKT